MRPHGFIRKLTVTVKSFMHWSSRVLLAGGERRCLNQRPRVQEACPECPSCAPGGGWQSPDAGKRPVHVEGLLTPDSTVLGPVEGAEVHGCNIPWLPWSRLAGGDDSSGRVEAASVSDQAERREQKGGRKSMRSAGPSVAGRELGAARRVWVPSPQGWLQHEGPASHHCPAPGLDQDGLGGGGLSWAPPQTSGPRNWRFP